MRIPFEKEKDVDENEQNHHQIGANWKGPRITCHQPCHVMAHKRILAKRNEALEQSSFDTNIQKISKLLRNLMNACLELNRNLISFSMPWMRNVLIHL